MNKPFDTQPYTKTQKTIATVVVLTYIVGAALVFTEMMK